MDTVLVRRAPETIIPKGGTIMRWSFVASVLLAGGPFAQVVSGAEPDLAAALPQLPSQVFSKAEAQERQLDQMLSRDIRRRRDAANQRETQAWRTLQSRADRERYRDARLSALKASLGTLPSTSSELQLRITRTLDGDGFRIENVIFQSRPGVWVTANLYGPHPPRPSMPGILIVHSHHNPKTQSELQDMGMTWARLGCLVLIMDQLGHGERRTHPFLTEKDYPGSFRPGRQDYYFRFNTGMQLHLVGESLIGWMVGDLMRGVDLLLSRSGIDKERIILLGSVAGGGDPAAVTAALDRRITAAAPFNFGGPQPETVYPLPEDAESRFNYAGSGSWESTRNLRLSCRDGFLPWVIVGSLAPRPLVYAHEFAWDSQRDPVWARLQQIYRWYDRPGNLASVAGRGSVTGKPPESTHCNNIGPVHRQQIYPWLQRWFGMPPPAEEYQQRRPSEDLLCWTPASLAELKPRPLHEVLQTLAADRLAEARRALRDDAGRYRPEAVRAAWARLLGDTEPPQAAKLEHRTTERLGSATVERLVLEVEPGIVVPTLLLRPERPAAAPPPVVVGVAQAGKQAFLRERAEVISRLLMAGIAVALPDLRGTGETQPGSGRGRQSAATALSSSELMLGGTMVGARLRDLRAVLGYLRSRDDFRHAPVALWGEAFAPANSPDRNLRVPLDAERLPDHAEPLGGLLAVFAALYAPEVKAVYAEGGLVGYESVLGSPFIYVPHDALVPGALTVGDLGDVTAALAPRRVRLAGLVTGVNRRATAEELRRGYAAAHEAYRQLGAGEALNVTVEPPTATELASWFRQALLAGK
ncbi:MAG: hypothetical protein NZ700_06545 [Gemmataceae bacterium]|nr:hypothetical protein [Gemmataceae bacterium]MDW8267006.1 hypothetical protein [Gemmataceae bacterium]